MATVAELLRSVAGSGELVSLVYSAGRRPGVARSVVPLFLTENELVAVEPDSTTKKTYRLDRVVSVSLSHGASASNVQADPEPVALPEVPLFGSLGEYAEYYKAELVVAGWHIAEEIDSFGIATRFKNGKPKKTPSVLIRFFDRSTELVFDMDSQEQRAVPRVLTGHERPWRVDSWRFREGKAVRELRHAFAVFIAEARASRPATAKNLWAGH